MRSKSIAIRRGNSKANKRIASSETRKAFHSNGKKDSPLHVPELKQAIRDLDKRAYNSQKEYDSVLSKAAGIIADMAESLAHAEADNQSSPKGKKIRKTIEVYPSTDGVADFQNIQNAIDRAWPGDKILLKCGTYKTGSAVWVWKDIVIEGEKGAVIEGLKERGKVIADPKTNGGFILLRNPRVEIRNMHFKNLYFAVASRDEHELDSLMLENNIFEDIYHSIYLSGIDSKLIALNNRIIISSLNQSSTSCRFNFYDESHIFGFYCSGIKNAIIEGNHIEVLSLQESAQFHSVGIFCSLGEAIIRNNFFKGLHAPLVLHEADSPLILNNQFYGMSSDPMHAPIAIMLEHCIDPVVSSNKISCRLSLGSGIYAVSNSKGKIISNEIALQHADSAIVMHKCDDFIIGKNNILNKQDCSIGVFGSQSADTKGNLIFSNSINGQLLMAYAKCNTVLGGYDEKDDSMHFAKIRSMLNTELEMDSFKRRERIYDHQDRKTYPDVPGVYAGEGNGQ